MARASILTSTRCSMRRRIRRRTAGDRVRECGADQFAPAFGRAIPRASDPRGRHLWTGLSALAGSTVRRSRGGRAAWAHAARLEPQSHDRSLAGRAAHRSVHATAGAGTGQCALHGLEQLHRPARRASAVLSPAKPRRLKPPIRPATSLSRSITTRSLVLWAVRRSVTTSATCSGISSSRNSRARTCRFSPMPRTPMRTCRSRHAIR
jgi:hypothetical protein